MPAQTDQPPLRDHTTFRVRSMDDLEEDAVDAHYWLTRPPEERLAAIETLRREWYGEDYVSEGLPGILVITRRAES